MSAIPSVYRRARGVSKQGACLSILGILAILTFTSAVTQSQQSSRVEGVVDSPRSFVGNLTPETRLGFGGWVNFPASQGQIQMDVLRFSNDVGSIAERHKTGFNPDQTPTNCNGNNEDPKLWAKNVHTITIDGTLSVVNGQNHYRWYTGTFLPFQPDAVASVPENRIPQGGIARVRFRAIVNGQETFLHGLDNQGVPTTGCELILGDASPSPAVPLKPVTSFGGVLPTPDYLDRGAAGTVADTRVYYDSIHVKPDGTGPRITDPTKKNEYGSSLANTGGIPTLTDFRLKYFETGKPGRTVNARYFNQADLGVGRNMYCRNNDETLETACYVENFGGADGSPVFDDFDQSVKAMTNGRKFATVAMVERGKMPAGSKNKVFFVVYDARGELQFNAGLDNKLFNKFVPGNCLACHGGKLERDPKGAVSGVSGASFLPFDLNSFRFYDDRLHQYLNQYGWSEDDYKGSRADLESKFKKLNEIVYNTDLFFNQDARTLINGWYGIPEPLVAPKIYVSPDFISFFPSPTFNDKFVPSGWNENDGSRQLYRQVVAPYCRTCHITESGPLGFGSIADFRSLREPIYQDVCVNHAMPNAEITSKQLWNTNARPQLLDRLNILHGCGWEPPNLNDKVFVEALQNTSKFVDPPAGCPAGYPVKSSFDLQIYNPAFPKTGYGGPNKDTVSDLYIEIASLTNGNLIILPDGSYGTAGAVFAAPIRQLAPNTIEHVQINICMKQKAPFTFAANLLGKVVETD